MSLGTDDTLIESGGGGPAELAPGTMLENYRIERLLGRGGMGAVYLAEHVRLGQRYALKVLPAELSGRGDFAQRFIAEGKRLAGLRHAGIVPVHYAGEAMGRHYFAMEYLGGGDLQTRFEAAGGRLPEGEVRRILRQVLAALVYAHGEGVIHRDLKPANILLESDEGGEPRIRITDFGLAQVVGEGYMRTLVQRTITASMLQTGETLIDSGSGSGSSGSLAGTIHFMAPEVVQGEAASERSDLYAVGVLGYYLLTGRKPVGRYTEASELVKGLSAAWDDFLNQLMAGDPERRTKTAAEALVALPDGRSVVAKQPEEEGVKVKKRKPVRRGGKAKWLALAVAVLALAAGAMWWLQQAEPVEPPADAVVEAEPIVEPPLPAVAPELPVATASPVLLQVDPADAAARIWLGPHADMQTGGDGALRLEEMPPGEHELIVQAPGYQPVVTRLAVPPGGLEHTVRLVPIRGTLEVVTTPGAEVLAVDARTLNFGILVAEAGAVELRLANDELRGGEGVQVLLDGREMSGRWRDGALTIEGLEVGQRSLEITHRSYRSHRSHFTVSDQQTTRHEVRLEPLPGQLVLSISGPAAGQWRVEVDDKAATPASGNVLELPAGRELALRVSARGWQDWERKVTLGAAERRTLPVRMEAARGPVPGQHAEVELPGGVKLELVWVAAMNMWVGKYEVTNDQFRAFRSGHDSGHFERNNRRFSLNGPRQPVVRVSYDDAVAFCEWLTQRERAAGRLPEGYRYRLPDGEEWTRYARCGTSRTYPWGNSMPPTRGNYSDLTAREAFGSGWYIIDGYSDGHIATAPVEQSGVNEWGLFGVGGNVWEWTSEQSGSSRVLSGASWYVRIPDFLRVEYRGTPPPSDRNYGLGFRVVLAVGG